MKSGQQVIVRTFTGTKEWATKEFQKDATERVVRGWIPISQSWAPGSYGFGSFLVALLLCFVLVGIFVFIYMLIVKPHGTLTVTYELRPEIKEKTCPKCAEDVKKAAVICRFCGHNFEPA